MPESDHDRIVRLEEQIEAERVALQLRSEELNRRLDILNHAHELARERDALFLPRELYETEHNLIVAAISDNREKLSSLIASGAGASRITANLLSVGALLVSVAVAIATIAYLATH